MILKHGILTIEMLNKLGIQKYTDKQLRIMSNPDSHVNAVATKQLNLDIPLREMSKENITIDTDKLSITPKILIK